MRFYTFKVVTDKFEGRNFIDDNKARNFKKGEV